MSIVAHTSELSFQNLPPNAQTESFRYKCPRIPMMENPLLTSSLPKAGGGLRKSTSTRSLASLVHVEALIREEKELVHQRRKSFQKPPRHASVPMYAQILLQLWQRELQRNDITLTSDFFYDLHGTKDQAAQLVSSMQALGFHLTLAQFVALRRCSIYAVLMIALGGAFV
ncbi:hypothetical protein PsorP6_018817 [Peronosclerospora sorghi]|nr:hypothetical protein PsorP6_018817 [Peronosclerospora sorghi]